MIRKMKFVFDDSKLTEENKNDFEKKYKSVFENQNDRLVVQTR
jgi:hypothetical protein